MEEKREKRRSVRRSQGRREQSEAGKMEERRETLRFVSGLPCPLLVVYCTGLPLYAVDVKRARW